jgi:hypothetical protein
LVGKVNTIPYTFQDDELPEPFLVLPPSISTRVFFKAACSQKATTKILATNDIKIQEFFG